MVEGGLLPHGRASNKENSEHSSNITKSYSENFLGLAVRGRKAMRLVGTGGTLTNKKVYIISYNTIECTFSQYCAVNTIRCSLYHSKSLLFEFRSILWVSWSKCSFSTGHSITSCFILYKWCIYQGNLDHLVMSLALAVISRLSSNCFLEGWYIRRTVF